MFKPMGLVCLRHFVNQLNIVWFSTVPQKITETLIAFHVMLSKFPIDNLFNSWTKQFLPLSWRHVENISLEY